MTCRHSPGDSNCSSSKSYVSPYYPPEPSKTPDATKYNVIDVAQVGNHLVLKVEYPNCKKCSYEGVKIMVFLNTTTLDALKWKKLDPHFREPHTSKSITEAPSPAARFPGSEEGWLDALEYAKSKK